MIELDNLTTGYHGKPLTQLINGTFERGSLTAIIGTNGCGKSTLLRTLAGLLPPVSGNIFLPESELVGWLPQQSELDHHFPITVFDVVAMGCWPAASLLRGLCCEALDRIESALDLVGLHAIAYQTINRLSGGQFQRMLFARMLVQDAQLMLLDEPFTGIDSQTSDALLDVITALHQQGKTLLVVLHNLAIVERAFPQTLWLHEGHYHWGETHHIVVGAKTLARDMPPASICPPFFNERSA